jgi:hypothetical protein
MAGDGGTLDVAQLIQAATDAARAAADAAAALRDVQASRGTGLSGKGFSEASKVIRQPDPFGSENHEEDLSKWQDFTVNFKAWLFYGDSGFESDLHRVETNYASTSIEFPDPSPMTFKKDANSFSTSLRGSFVASRYGYCARLLREMVSRFGGNWCNSFHQRPKAGRFPCLLR